MDKRIEQLLETIDFDKLQSIYQFLEIKWIDDGLNYIPSTKDLRDRVISKAQYLLKHKCDTISSGCLEVYVENEDYSFLLFRFEYIPYKESV